MWIVAFGGCLGALNGDVKSGATESGAKAPWAERDSSADIVVSNTRSESVNATLSIDENEQSLSIGANEDWVSEDILETREDGMVTVSTPDGLSATVEWVSEDESTNRICVFNIDPERIRTDMFVK